MYGYFFIILYKYFFIILYKYFFYNFVQVFFTILYKYFFIILYKCFFIILYECFFIILVFFYNFVQVFFIILYKYFLQFCTSIFFITLYKYFFIILYKYFFFIILYTYFFMKCVCLFHQQLQNILKKFNIIEASRELSLCFRRSHIVVNVIISSFMWPPEEYPTVTDFSLWSVCSFFHSHLHLLCLYTPHLFAAYVTTIFPKYYLPHQFFHYVHLVPCWQPVIFLCAFFISIPSFSIWHDWS